MLPRTERLVAELKLWCDAQRGRQSEVARRLGMRRQHVYQWLKGQRHPSLEQGLAVLELLYEKTGSLAWITTVKRVILQGLMPTKAKKQKNVTEKRSSADKGRVISKKVAKKRK